MVILVEKIRSIHAGGSPISPIGGEQAAGAQPWGLTSQQSEQEFNLTLDASVARTILSRAASPSVNAREKLAITPSRE